MMGPLNNPGLIPRSFDVIFNSIGSYLGKKYVRIVFGRRLLLFHTDRLVSSVGSTKQLRSSK